MVAADSDRIPRVPPYSGGTLDSLRFLYGTFTPYGYAFQQYSSSYTSLYKCSYNPAKSVNSTV